SYSRNRKVAATFKEAQLIEKYGSGIRRIREAFEQYGLKPPTFENFQHGFRVVVYAEKSTDPDKTSGKTVVKTVGKAAHIYDLIKSNPQITREQLADETGLSVRGVEYHLKNLRDTNRISRVGPKGGYWEVIDD